MTEIKNIDLAGILSNAETIKGQRNRNRLDEILNPMKAQQAQIEIDEATRAQAVNEGKVFLSTLGDISKLPENDQQAAWANARETLRRFGSDDVDDIPELFDSQVLQGIQGVVSSGAGGKAGRLGSQEILADGTVIQSTSEGPKVFTAGGELLQGQDAIDAVRKGREFGVQNQQAIYGGRRAGTLGADIQLGGQAEGAKVGGKFDVEESRKIGLESFQNARTIRSSLSLYDDAIDALQNGANTGAIASFFPTIKAESKRLENIQNRLGLSIIQSTTFGALSEAEMRLAMETAVPTGLDEKELIKWLQDKKDAQTKAAEALENASAELLSGRKNLADLADAQSEKNISGDVESLLEKYK